MSARILVTGASGFIGKNLIKKLLQGSEQVYGIVKSDIKPLKDLLSASRIYKLDLSNYHLVEKAVKKIKPDIIFHLSAYPDKGNKPEHIINTFSSNVVGTFNLLRATSNLNYKRLVFSGSYKEYGSQPVPFKEHYILNPLSCYAASKAAAEAYCKLFHSMGKPIVRLRFSTVYGPGQRGTAALIPMTIQNALKGKEIIVTSGNQARDFIHIDDTVDALIKSASIPHAVGEALNIGSGYEIQIKKVVETIVNLCRSKSAVKIGALPQRRNEVMHMFGDISKAARILNWQPNTKLETGLRNTIEWHKMQMGL